MSKDKTQSFLIFLDRQNHCVVNTSHYTNLEICISGRDFQIRGSKVVGCDENSFKKNILTFLENYNYVNCLYF